MNTADIVLIAGIVLAVVFALRRIYKMKKSGCSCGCAECGKDCAQKKT